MIDYKQVCHLHEHLPGGVSSCGQDGYLSTNLTPVVPLICRAYPHPYDNQKCSRDSSTALRGSMVLLRTLQASENQVQIPFLGIQGPLGPDPDWPPLPSIHSCTPSFLHLFIHMSPDVLLSQAWPEPPHLGAHTPDVWDVQTVDRAMVRDAQGIVGVQREHLICPRVKEVFLEEPSLSQVLEDRLVFTK